MLKWDRHDAVAVLDGGLQAWEAAGGAIESGAAVAASRPAYFRLGPSLRRLLMDEVMSHLGQSDQVVADARATARYRGEVEPMEAVASHIPGALNRPFSENFDSDGRFKPPAQLRAEFTTLLGECNPSDAIHRCSSGVSTVPNLIAMSW